MVWIFRKESKQIKFLGCKILFFSIDIHSSGGFINTNSPDFNGIIGFLTGVYQAIISVCLGKTLPVFLFLPLVHQEKKNPQKSFISGEIFEQMMGDGADCRQWQMKGDG